MTRLLVLLLGLTLGQTAEAVDIPCGAETPCALENGTYYLMGPEDWDGATPLPALVFFHGHRSSGRTIFRGGTLRTAFRDAGYLIIAPDGFERADGVRAWPARPEAQPLRDDVAFTLDVLDDVAARLPIDLGRVYASGFSAGGSMAWMVGCYAADRFAGVVSVAGALRRPIPEETCPSGPFPLLQIHGYSDGQVPLEGRGIGNWHQGDVFEALNLLRRTNGCRSNPTGMEAK